MPVPRQSSQIGDTHPRGALPLNTAHFPDSVYPHLMPGDNMGTCCQDDGAWRRDPLTLGLALICAMSLATGGMQTTAAIPPRPSPLISPPLPPGSLSPSPQDLMDQCIPPEFANSSPVSTGKLDSSQTTAAPSHPYVVHSTRPPSDKRHSKLTCQ